MVNHCNGKTLAGMSKYKSYVSAVISTAKSEVCIYKVTTARLFANICA